MLKRVNFESLHEDLRKIGVAALVGGITGLAVGSDNKVIPFTVLVIIGAIIWYLGLSDGGINGS